MSRTAFHIGYHKTGSSWLQQVYFPRHPQIRLASDSKQPWNDPFLSYVIKTSDFKFDSDHGRTLFHRQISSLGALSSQDVVLFSAERLSGHPFSGGYDCLRTAQRIKACVSDAKIICVIRNQVDMLNSVYKQLVNEGYTGHFDSLFRHHAWKGVGPDLSFYEYDIVIDSYMRIFGRQNVCVMSYETMQSDKVTFLKSVCSFLEIPYVNLPLDHLSRAVNMSLPSRWINFFRLLNYFRQTELNMFPLMTIPLFIREALIRFLRVIPKSDRGLSVAVTEKIEEYFQESNARLKVLTGIHLPGACRRNRG